MPGWIITSPVTSKEITRACCTCRGLKDLIKEAQQEMEQQGTVAFSPRTTSLTVTRPRGQKPADERFFEKLENQARTPLALPTSSLNMLLT